MSDLSRPRRSGASELPPSGHPGPGIDLYWLPSARGAISFGSTAGSMKASAHTANIGDPSTCTTLRCKSVFLRGDR